MKLVESTLESIPVLRPIPTDECPQGLCLDKGYDHAVVRRGVRQLGFTPHVRSRREEKVRDPSKPARRWVVERTHSWMNRFRRILVRWEKKARNYLAMLHLTCAMIVFKKVITE
jgi:transposase